MPSIDDFRFKAHHLLLDLDATTNHLMMLVGSRDVSGPSWEEGVARHRQAYEAWASILTRVQTDPMPALDGRPPQDSASSPD
ncbi:hypothetical protein [Pseudomonas fluorescens]|uniref:hypothetical protein n=1 Tax=Pseudomonas fluorescens TaxID=294 RepID=UPI0012414635|nr:hypothetical protein [Pseudomonas fluorescens]